MIVGRINTKQVPGGVAKAGKKPCLAACVILVHKINNVTKNRHFCTDFCDKIARLEFKDFV